ncbi:MAG: lipocalin family protein [Cytophagaceae bacterium]|jgi:hypothetical protein|nr:lipocalin family protein [Cytophagaceae bacterium]
MKKFFLASAILSVVLFSCKKEKETEEVTTNNSPTAPLTIKGKMKAGNWYFAKALEYIDGEGYDWIDFDACEQDDYLTFVGDSAFFDDGVIQCSPTNSDRYRWIQSEESLRFTMNGAEYFISKLDSDSLIFYEVDGLDSTYWYLKNTK